MAGADADDGDNYTKVTTDKSGTALYRDDKGFLYFADIYLRPYSYIYSQTIYIFYSYWILVVY